MKKKKEKSLEKTTIKTAQRVIKISLITELEDLAGKLGQTSKKMNKEIEKGSKKLAKKLARKFKVNPAMYEADTVENSSSSKEPVEAAEPKVKKTAPSKKAENGKIEI